MSKYAKQIFFCFKQKNNSKLFHKEKQINALNFLFESLSISTKYY